MTRILLRIGCRVLLVGLVGSLAVLDSISGLALSGATDGGLAAPFHVITPTPIPPEVSTSGSTDGIVWMGIVIAVIILIPILLSKSTWTRS